MLSLPLIYAITVLAPVKAGIYDQVPFFPVYDNSTPPILAVQPAQWAALNATVGGRLILGAPFAQPCFDKYEGWVSERCKQLRTTYHNSCKAV